VGYATGGQKSAFECFLTEAERRDLALQLQVTLDLSEDRAHVVRLRRNCASGPGVAVPPQDPVFFYVG